MTDKLNLRPGHSSGLDRRTFLRSSAVGAGVASWTGTGLAQVRSANEKINVALIGCGGRGPGVASGMGGVQFVCDPDTGRLAAAAKKFGVRSQNAVSDLRRIIDNNDVDAVIIATPDHWHAPAAILACNAGKHVYVEKPCSHNFRENQLLLQAARRNNVVVQHGTQSRTNPFVANAIQLLREGIIGDVLMAKCWNVQRRANIGHASPSAPPAGLDYDTWIGPAEAVPYQANRLHYNWHWWYNFGTGDIGNDGVHEIDYARWGLGVEGLPNSATAIGGKYYFDDDQQFPDTATCTFEWPGDGSVGHRRQLIFEMRIWSLNYPYNVDGGAEFYGTEGRMFLSKRGKVEIVADRNKPRAVPTPNTPPEFVGNHQEDFLDAIRTSRRPEADIQIGHDSTALVHLANIAVRHGRSLEIDVEQGTLHDSDASSLLSRTYRDGGHWAIPDGAA